MYQKTGKQIASFLATLLLAERGDSGYNRFPQDYARGRCPGNPAKTSPLTVKGGMYYETKHHRTGSLHPDGSFCLHCLRSGVYCGHDHHRTPGKHDGKTLCEGGSFPSGYGHGGTGTDHHHQRGERSHHHPHAPPEDVYGICGHGG